MWQLLVDASFTFDFSIFLICMVNNLECSRNTFWKGCQKNIGHNKFLPLPLIKCVFAIWYMYLLRKRINNFCACSFTSKIKSLFYNKMKNKKKKICARTLKNKLRGIYIVNILLLY